MGRKTKKEEMFEGFPPSFEAFINHSILFCMKEATTKNQAEEILFEAYSTKASNYSEIEKIYHQKFPTEKTRI